MRIECKKCSKHGLDCLCWKESKNELPRLGEVVGDIFPLMLKVKKRLLK